MSWTRTTEKNQGIKKANHQPELHDFRALKDHCRTLPGHARAPQEHPQITRIALEKCWAANAHPEPKCEDSPRERDLKPSRGQGRRQLWTSKRATARYTGRSAITSPDGKFRGSGLAYWGFVGNKGTWNVRECKGM